HDSLARLVDDGILRVWVQGRVEIPEHAGRRVERPRPGVLGQVPAAWCEQIPVQLEDGFDTENPIPLRKCALADDIEVGGTAIGEQEPEALAELLIVETADRARAPEELGQQRERVLGCALGIPRT